MIKKEWAKNKQDYINVLFLEHAEWLDEVINHGVKNLIQFGYTRKFDIEIRVSSFFDYHTRLDPKFGIVNLSTMFDTVRMEKFDKLEEEFIEFLYIDNDKDESQIEHEHNVMVKTLKLSHHYLVQKYPDISVSNHENFFKDYISYLSTKYTNEYIDNNSKKFFDKKFTKELAYILNFFNKNKIMPSDLTIHESGDGGGKDSDEIFHSDISLNEPLEIQISDDELLFRKEGQTINIMFIFKDKKLRDALNRDLIKLYEKKTNVYDQERINGSHIKSFFIECDIDWVAN